MAITIQPEVEAKLRAQAKGVGLSVERYIEQIADDRSVEEELEALVLEGLESGGPFEPGPDYWADKHRWLDARLRDTTPK